MMFLTRFFSKTCIDMRAIGFCLIVFGFTVYGSVFGQGNYYSDSTVNPVVIPSNQTGTTYSQEPIYMQASRVNEPGRIYGSDLSSRPAPQPQPYPLRETGPNDGFIDSDYAFDDYEYEYETENSRTVNVQPIYTVPDSTGMASSGTWPPPSVPLRENPQVVNDFVQPVNPGPMYPQHGNPHVLTATRNAGPQEYVQPNAPLPMAPSPGGYAETNIQQEYPRNQHTVYPPNPSNFFAEEFHQPLQPTPPQPVPVNNFSQPGYPVPNQPVQDGFRSVEQIPQPVNPFFNSYDNELEPGKILDSGVTNLASGDPVVIDVKFIGNTQVPISEVKKHVKTRKDRPFSITQVEEDKRALMQTKKFIDVRVDIKKDTTNPNGRIVTFELIGRRLMLYVKFVGNQGYSRDRLLEESQLKVNDALDPISVRQGKERLESFYKMNGFKKVHIEILSGDRPDDRGVVFLIDEGVKQRIAKTEFVGNSAIVSTDRLKAKIESKPGFLWMFFKGKFTRKQLDDDIETLTNYYRDLGFYHAKIDADFQEGEGITGLGKKNAWITIRFIIHEGPRCRVNNIKFIGNTLFSESEFLDEMYTQSGEYFSGPRLIQDIAKIRDMYGNEGHVFANVKDDTTLEDELINIVINIKEGKPAQVSDLSVEIVGKDGAEPYTKQTVVIDVLGSRLKPNSKLKLFDINRSKTSLTYSGIFENNPAMGKSPVIEFHEPKNEAEQQDEFERTAYRGLEPMGYSSQGQKNNINPQERISVPPVQIPPIPEYRAPEEDYRDVPLLYRGQSFSIPEYRTPEEDYRNNESLSYRGQSRTVPSLPRTTTQPVNDVYYSDWEPAPVAAPVYADPNMVYGAVNQPSNPQPAQVAQYPQGTVRPYEPGMATQPVNGQYEPIRVQTQPYQQNPYQNQQYEQPANNNPYAYQGQNPQNVEQSSFIDRTLFAPPQPYVPGPYNPTTNGGGIMDATMPGSPELQYSMLGTRNGKPNQFVPVPVVARVHETNTGMFQASIAVNSDVGLQGKIMVEERNFDFWRFPKNPRRWEDYRNAFRGGGQLMRVEASPGVNISRYEVTWQEPYLFHTRIALGLSGFYYNRYYDEWKEDRLGGTVSLGYALTPELRVNTFFNAQTVDIRERIYPVPPDLADVKGKNDMYSFGISVSHDTRDSRYISTEGHSYTFGVEQVFGSHTFTRANFDLRKYITLHERPDTSGRWVLGLRSAASITETGTPIYERYYGGGFTSMRGFEFRGISPRWNGIPTGGNFEFYNSAELLFPLSGDDAVRGVLFVDTGTIESKIDKWESKYRVTVGFGLRVAIPMMGPAPIAFDFGFPIHRDSMDERQVFSFSMTGTR